MKKYNIILILIIFLFVSNTAYAFVTRLGVSIAPDTINFHLEDPYGNITGYTPNGIMKQIPNMTEYSLGMLSVPQSSDLGEYEIYHYVSHAGTPVQIPEGKYKIVIYGTTIPRNILIKLTTGVGIDWFANNKLMVFIYPNSIWTYELDVPTVPPIDKKLVLTKVSTPTDLIKDLTTAGQLGYIGNTKFVTELTKEINEIEAEKAKGKVDDSLTPAQKTKKEYTELLSEITERYNKPESDEFVKKEAYDVLKEDLEYIINHIQ